MLEFALEKYPVCFRFADDVRCEVRPLVKADERGFHEFYVDIPENERLFLKHRVTDGTLFHEWCRHIDYENNLPLLVLSDGMIIGDATLHQRQGGWKRHIGLVSVLIRPEFRGLGIMNTLVCELVEIARHCGLTKLEAEVSGEQEKAIEALVEADFRELARIRNHVQDSQANYHDFVVMGMNLQIDEEFAGVGD